MTTQPSPRPSRRGFLKTSAAGAAALGGLTLARSVHAQGSDVLDHNAVVYEYPGGVRMYAVGRAQNGCYGETSDLFLGTKGRCDVINHRIQGETNWQYEGPKCNMYEAEHAALFQAVRAGKPVNNGHYMATSTMLGILGQMAAYTGRQIPWEDALKAAYRIPGITKLA